jgi:NhaA family Na+:H+ antiporter
MASLAKRTTDFILGESLLLIAGAVCGMLWANLHHASYQSLLQFQILTNAHIGEVAESGARVINLRFVVNEILMAFFFALAGREVWSAFLPGGPLNRPRQAATPIICTLGGMTGPAILYLAGAAILGHWSDLRHGWAVPCATDIAFSYMVARLIFGRGHPAIAFLLLLAIADDALGMAVLAIFYPSHEVHLVWLLLSALAVGVGLLLQRLRVHSFGWYLVVPGILSWFGFALAGLHPALGLLPIVPTIPHVRIHRESEGWNILRLGDKRGQMEYWLRNPVEGVLGLFSLFNAGVVLSNVGAPTFIVCASLVLGKPLGIFLTGLLCVKLLGLRLADGLTLRGLWVMGCVAGIGFTVATFVATVAFPAGPIQDAAKMGCLASFVAAIVAYVMARLFGIQRARSKE